MEKNVRLGYLYDFYGELLPQHGRDIIERIVEDDLSLSELSSELGVTRQAVHDVKRRYEKTLEGYEEKLHLLEKYMHSRELLLEMSKIADENSEDDALKRMFVLAEKLVDNWILD